MPLSLPSPFTPLTRLLLSPCTPPSPLCSSGVNESRQVLQEPDFAQSLLRDPHIPIIRKSRGTSTQGTSTHASSTHLAILDEPDDPRHAPDDRRPIHSLGHVSSTRSKAGSVHSKTSYHGSLHRSRDGR
ncbi:unnamed protein product [Coregonus sp. 'balchen']|nr:unnamed protein product [Coregonus sp. 'balchen']